MTWSWMRCWDCLAFLGWASWALGYQQFPFNDGSWPEWLRVIYGIGAIYCIVRLSHEPKVKGE